MKLEERLAMVEERGWARWCWIWTCCIPRKREMVLESGWRSDEKLSLQRHLLIRHRGTWSISWKVGTRCLFSWRGIKTYKVPPMAEAAWEAWGQQSFAHRWRCSAHRSSKNSQCEDEAFPNDQIMQLREITTPLIVKREKSSWCASTPQQRTLCMSWRSRTRGLLREERSPCPNTFCVVQARLERGWLWSWQGTHQKFETQS